MRGQILFRNQGSSGDRAFVGAVGIVEVAAGLLPEDVVLGVEHAGASERFRLAFTGQAVDVSTEMASGKIDQAARMRVWPMPARSDQTGGGLVFRRTRMTARPGNEIYAFLGVLACAPGAVLAGDRYEMAVEISCITMANGAKYVSGHLEAHSPRPCPATEERGVQLGMLLERPLWGFGEDPVGFYSTLRLDVIDDLRRYDRIRDRDPALLTADDRRFMNEMRNRRDVTSILQDDRDDMYAEFRRRWREAFGVEDWSQVLTARDLAAREQAAAEIIMEMAPDGSQLRM